MQEQSSDERALSFLRALSHEEREQLVQAFEGAQPAITLQALADRVAKETKLKQEGVRDVAASIGSWCGILEPSRQKSDPSGVGIVLGILGLDPEAEAEGEKSLNAHVSRLLACERSLGTTSKAQGILWDNPRNFRDVRVVTEVRPVFPSNLGQPEAAVVIHQLKIAYTEAGIDKEVHVAMDRNCLVALYNTLERAWQKEKSLREQNAYRYLDLE